MAPDPTPFRLEAEDFDSLGTFRAETLGAIASGGAGIRLPLGSEGAPPGVSGTASAAFTGAAGTYTVSVRYFDEGDGTAGLSFARDGMVLDAWLLDAAGVGWTPDSGNGRTRTISGVTLDTGDLIALTGTRGGEEYARVDYVEFTPEGTAPPPPPPPEEPPPETPQTQRIEAESFSSLGGFTVESLGAFASGGAGIRLPFGSEGAAPGVTATASTAFTGAAGTYSIAVRFFDEGDGTAGLSLSVNGVVRQGWALDAGSGWGPEAGNARTVTVTGITLAPGDTIALTGTRGGEEYARVDYIELTPEGSTPPPPPPPPPEEPPPPPPPEEPPPETPQTQRIEAEDFASLNGYGVENLGGIASGGEGIRLPLGSEGAPPGVTGTASTAFTGASGTYAITVRYFDEGDGAAGLALAVNGQTVDGWTMNASGVGWTPDSGNGRSHTITGVTLEHGDTLTLTGTRNGEEYARVDYIEVVPASAPPPPPPPPPPPDGGTVGTEAIMPLGDSITDGDGNGGYRAPLYRQLVGDGYDVDFVGTLKRGAPDIDPDNEGHSGWTIGMVEDSLPTWLDLNPPETVLLMIGTNDILGGQSAASTAAELSGLLDTLFAEAPGVDVFLGELLPIDPTRWTSATPQIAAAAQAYNDLLPGVVAEHRAAGHSVTLVTMDEITTADLVDGVHPGQSGFATIADNYYQAMLSSGVLNDALAL
ncbi:GDSL-type esterase/lipase family protein [Novispirillum sp. DQ9]|uniref:GDSL-type esterase/lipase family protein n=1 Tax=Novispirillum sp. DQ9 TaxID=3398612 RepID=UPI003C7CE01B